MKKEEISQLTLRFENSLIAKIKLRAKAEKVSVNSLAMAMIEYGLADQDNKTELFKLFADPITTLTRIHRKICDPWSSGNVISLSDDEISFLADGAIKRLDKTLLAGPFYERIRNEAKEASQETDHDILKVLFSFTLRYYIESMDQRMEFAARNAPDGIESRAYEFDVADMTFKFIVSGNEMNRFKSPDDHTPPTIFMLIKINQIEARHYWDTISALARILEAVKTGAPFESRTGSDSWLTKDRNEKDSWLLFLGKMQLRLTDNELVELATRFCALIEGEAAINMQQLRLVYGEG